MDITDNNAEESAWILQFNDSIRKLIEPKTQSFREADKERHRIYSYLVLALCAQYWNGNKHGRPPEVVYTSKRADKMSIKIENVTGDYYGHNIACIAVDGRGRVLDFDFNHNYLFSSSVEHAEARLVRRIFSLANLQDAWVLPNGKTAEMAPKLKKQEPGGLEKVAESEKFSNSLTDVSIYTSLESCAQCSGIMALGSVKEVVYMQPDPGQFSIGNILYNLPRESAWYSPPTPIPADSFDLPHFGQLKEGFEKFKKNTIEPLYTKSGAAKFNPSITSYLCTEHARAIFESGRTALNTMELAHSDCKPLDQDGRPKEDALSNQEVLDHVKQFLNYAEKSKQRGTTHPR